MLVRSTVTRLRLRVHTQSQGSRSLRLAVRARNPRGLRWFEAKLARSALLARRCALTVAAVRVDPSRHSAWNPPNCRSVRRRRCRSGLLWRRRARRCGGGSAEARAQQGALLSPWKLHRTAPHRTAQPDSVAAEAVGHVAAAPTDSCTALRDQCNTCNACVHGLSSCANVCGCIGAHLRGRAGERAVNVS